MSGKRSISSHCQKPNLLKLNDPVRYSFEAQIINIFKAEPINAFESLNSILLSKAQEFNDNPLFMDQEYCSETLWSEGHNYPSSWIEYYYTSAVEGILLDINDPIYGPYWKKYKSWGD
jgi:hypothetical protein